VGGLLTKLVVEPAAMWAKNRWQERKEPERRLQEADDSRRRMTESSLTSAINKYTSLLKNNRINSPAKLAAYRGLSRTYSDLALFKYWMGTSLGDAPDNARSWALKAAATPNMDFDTGIALAYSFESSELDSSVKPATKGKVQELYSLHPDNPDIEYLAWQVLLNDKARLYPERLNANDLSDLRILIRVGMHFVRTADGQLGAERERTLGRAREFLVRANLVSPDHPMVLNALGVLAEKNNNRAEAESYYQKAVTVRPEFPRARNNLGKIYSEREDYRKAREQFAGALSKGAPAAGQQIWLNNLGDADFELDDFDKACEDWQQAAGLPVAEENVHTILGLAKCSFVKGKREVARETFKRAVELGCKSGTDLMDMATLRNWGAGRKELSVASALIKDAGGSMRCRIY